MAKNRSRPPRSETEKKKNKPQAGTVILGFCELLAFCCVVGLLFAFLESPGVCNWSNVLSIKEKGIGGLGQILVFFFALHLPETFAQ